MGCSLQETCALQSLVSLGVCAVPVRSTKDGPDQAQLALHRGGAWDDWGNYPVEQVSMFSILGWQTLDRILAPASGGSASARPAERTRGSSLIFMEETAPRQKQGAFASERVGPGSSFAGPRRFSLREAARAFRIRARWMGRRIGASRFRPAAVAAPRGILDQAVRQIDARLRRQQHIFEFCRSSHCLLRVALTPARENLALPGGMAVRCGELTAELHLWNEHMPRIPDAGPNLSWAALAKSRMRESLELLAAWVQSDSQFARVRFFCADTLLGAGKSHPHVKRLATYFGFDLLDVPSPRGWRERLIALGEGVHLWAMVRAFNPGALAGRRLLRSQRHQFWMSREALLKKYAAVPRFHSSAALEPPRPGPALVAAGEL
jgi:hypothetical protein